MRKDLIERLRSVKWEVTDDGNRMPDDHTHKCVFVDMRPDDFRDLLRKAATALEAAQEDLIEWKEGNPPEEEVPPATVEQTETALLLVGDVDTDNIDVEAWTDKQRSLAYDWAIAVHFYASDNEDVVVPPRPDFIPRKEFNGL